MKAAVGVAHHNGWAVLVTMGLEEGEPRLIDRRRVPLVEEGLPNQPYEHHCLGRPVEEATALVARVRASAMSHARLALETLRADLAPAHDLACAAVRPSRFGRLPEDINEVTGYRPLVYAADGMLYAEVVEDTARAMGLAVLTFEKDTEFALAGTALGIEPAEAEAELKALGKAAGPPWTAEHLKSAAAALGAL